MAISPTFSHMQLLEIVYVGRQWLLFIFCMKLCM